MAEGGADKFKGEQSPGLVRRGERGFYRGAVPPWQIEREGVLCGREHGANWGK